jgi:hypothetical protein
MIQTWEYSKVAAGHSQLLFDVKGIPDGFYVLKVRDGNRSSTAKVMIRK